MSVNQQAQWQGPESGNGMQPLLMLIIELCVSCYAMSKCMPWKGTPTEFRSLCLSERKSLLTSALIWPPSTRASWHIVDMLELLCGWHGYDRIRASWKISLNALAWLATTLKSESDLKSVCERDACSVIRYHPNCWINTCRHSPHIPVKTWGCRLLSDAPDDLPGP